MTPEEHKLVEDNMGLAYKIAGQYYKKFAYKIELEELQSISFIGLVRAAQLYDRTRNIAFSTFAYIVIRNEVLIFYNSNRNYLRQPSVSIYESIGDDIYIQDILKSDRLDDKVEMNVQINQLHDYILELPELDQIIINKKLEGYTSKQIGEDLNLTYIQVNNRYREAINKLRKKFKI